MDEEVKVTYPEEVYRAYMDKETYAKLDIESTCVLRIGNQNKKYGLSPIFRAIYPALMLNLLRMLIALMQKPEQKKSLSKR